MILVFILVPIHLAIFTSNKKVLALCSEIDYISAG